MLLTPHPLSLLLVAASLALLPVAAVWAQEVLPGNSGGTLAALLAGFSGMLALMGWILRTYTVSFLKQIDRQQELFQSELKNERDYHREQLAQERTERAEQHRANAARLDTLAAEVRAGRQIASLIRDRGCARGGPEPPDGQAPLPAAGAS